MVAAYVRFPSTVGFCFVANLRSFPDSFWKHVEQNSRSGCWVWTGAVAGNGGPSYHPPQMLGAGGGRVVSCSPALFAWRRANGPVPGGHIVYHRCSELMCVNPDHLRAGTPRRARAEVPTWCPPRTSPDRVCCKHGHLMAGKNVVVRGGKPACRECERTRARESYRRRREAGLI